MKHRDPSHHGNLWVPLFVAALLLALAAACSDAPTDPAADASSVVQEGVLADGTPVLEYEVRPPAIGSGQWSWGPDPSHDQTRDDLVPRWLSLRASSGPPPSGSDSTWHTVLVDLVPESVPPERWSWGTIDIAGGEEYFDPSYFDPSTFGRSFVQYSQSEAYNYIDNGRWYHATEGSFTIDRISEREVEGWGVEEVLEGRVEARVKATEAHAGYPDEYMIRVRFTLVRSTPVSW